MAALTTLPDGSQAIELDLDDEDFEGVPDDLKEALAGLVDAAKAAIQGQTDGAEWLKMYALYGLERTDEWRTRATTYLETGEALFKAQPGKAPRIDRTLKPGPVTAGGRY